MLRITNGKMSLSVTKGAFENTYKDRGFWPLDMSYGEKESGEEGMHLPPESHHLEDSTQQGFAEDDSETEDEEDDSEEETSLSEIPLSEMSFEQLYNYADELELDHDGMRSKKELRALIREHLKG